MLPINKDAPFCLIVCIAAIFNSLPQLSALSVASASVVPNDRSDLMSQPQSIPDAFFRAYPIIAPHPFGGRGVWGEGGSNRCRFSQSIPTFACPHPNPLPEGEGDFLG